MEIPARWPRPVVLSNIEVVSDLGGTNADPTLGVIGGVRVTGPRSGPWHIIIPITDMDGGQMIRILYKDVLVPYRTQFEPGYDFPLRVKGSGSGARLRQVDVEADDTGRPNSGNIEIDVTDARPGSGIMEVTSGGVAAGSEDNTLTFVYTAAGTLSGGALELVPPDGWTTPQGTRGSPGYTTATPSSAVEEINFAENRGAGRPGFSEGSINILFRTMRAGNTIEITYSEVTVPVDAVSTEFDVYVGPDFSEVGIGSGSGFDTAKFDRSKAPIVYVQAGHGSGIVTIEEDVDNNGVADGDSDQIVHAGEELALIFTFTADGDMDGGQFIMNVDSSWPQPTNVNTKVTSTGTTDNVSIRSQRREIIVTLESLSANQIITVRYGGGEKISAPGIPQISEFSFESTSTEGGVPAGINPPDDSPDIFKVEVIQAADGSGKVTLAESQRTVFAGSSGNDFSITYEAVGVIDSGQIEFTVPDAWTPFKDTDDTVHLTTTAAGISLSDEEPDVNDRTITYDISTSRAGGTVTFRYTNVIVQAVIADAASDGIDNDGDGLTDGGDTDETGAGQVLLDVKVKGDDESGRNLESVTDTEAKITIDNTADGGGLAEITIAEAGTATSLPKNEDGVYDDVYAGHKVDITIVYTADGTMSSALDDNLSIATEGSDLDLARKGLTSLELTIPSAFTRPDYGTDTDAPGHLTVTHSRGSARPTPQFKPFGYSPKITNVVLARDETLTITFENVTTPAALGSHDFIVRSQGRAAVDGDGRSLKPLTAGYPRVTIGSVKSGVGDAYVHSINGTVIVADDRAKLDKKKILGGQEGVTIEFVFKATGAFDGEVRFDAPSGWNEPGGESGVPGYTQVRFDPSPSSGASIGSTTDFKYERVNQAIIIPVKMGKDDQLVIAYGANGGNSGLRVPEVNSARAYNFDIETKRKGDTSFADVPKARNNAVDLQIQATPIDGSGTVNVDTDVVINTTDNNERKRDLVFTYRAHGEIGSVRLERPTPWPQFQHPENTGTDVDNNGGKVSISGDRQGTSNLGAGATASSVRFDFSPKLTEGQSVRIRYQNVRIPTAAAEYQFKFFSGTAVGGQGLLVSNVSVIVVSEDGSGKVSSTVRDTGEQSNNELVIENVRRAGIETILVFYYNLDDSGADEKEYIRNGRLRITAPSEWTLLQKDKAVEQRDTADLKIADIEARKDNKPVLELSGSDIIVTIPEQKNREYIKITVKANTPTRRDKSQFTVESQTSQAGTLTGIRKNTVSSPVVIVDVVDADDGTGTVTSNIPATVPSGSRDNVFVITYTAIAELSTRKADGDLATATEIGGKPSVVSDGSDFSGVSSNIEVAGIQLRIPNTWATPNFADTEENPVSSANVRVDGPGSAFFNFDTTKGGYDEDLVIDNVTGFHTISVPIKQLEAGESITLTYGAGTDKAEAQPGTGDKVGIYILSKGGVDGDTFTNVKKSGPLADDGKFQFNVGPAGDGTGTATAMVTENAEDSNSVVHGGDSGIEIEFTYTATGVIRGGAIRLQVPEGWTAPQGLPGRPGYTRQKTSDTLRLGLPVYDDAARTVTFTTGAADLTSTSGNVTIVYGDRSGTTATPENNGAYSPKVGATGDKAGKFLVRMRGTSQFATVAELPIDVTNAKDGTGRFEISPANTRAGQHGTYMVKYTAEGPLKDGAVRLVIPENWGYGNGTDEVLPDKDNLKVSTVGGKLGKPTYPVETATGAGARTVIANIEALNGDETVTFTLVTKAQPNGMRADPGIPAGFTVASTREPSTVSNPRNDGDFVLLALKTRGDAFDRVKDITVRQAADGSGSFVALDGSNEVVNIIKFGGKPGTIRFKFTPEGTMEASGLIELDIPAGWTDGVKGAIGDTDAGKIFLDDGTGNAPTGVELKEVVDKRKVVVNIVSPGLRVNADDDDEFFIVYETPTAPSPSAGQDYLFTARSRSTHDDHADLQPLPEPKYPTIFVSKPGIGSGSMQVYNYPRDSATRNLDPDKRTVVEDVRAADGVTLTFVYTAADDIQGGELRVAIPSEWSEAEDNIFNAHPSETESRRRNKVTFRTLGTALDAAEHNNDVNVEAFADDSRLIIIPIPSLSARDQVIFQYKGTVQNTADEAGVSV